MNNDISLNVAMRSNLLSLQNIAGKQNIVQNRLATGLKVSSAIDNPSSFYTAQSLNNRASDLTALLVSMAQGIQTIKAANEAIEAGTKMLEQASSVASQALTTNDIPSKEWFSKQVGPDGAVVSSAEELKEAIKSDKKTIVIYGTVEVENETITLKTGQTLLGTEYFTRESGRERFSKLILKTTDNIQRNFIITGNTNQFSDLTIRAKTNYRGEHYVINGSQTSFTNVKVEIDNPSYCRTIRGSLTTLSGNIHLTNFPSHMDVNIKKDCVLVSENQLLNMGDINIEDNVCIYTTKITSHMGRHTTLKTGKNVKFYFKDVSFLSHLNSPAPGNSITFNSGVEIYSPSGAWKTIAPWTDVAIDSHHFYNNLDGIPEFERISNQIWEFPDLKPWIIQVKFKISYITTQYFNMTA